jgi:hypothetical protein
MSLFDEHIRTPLDDGLSKPYLGIPIALPKLSRVINYVERGQNVTIAGKPTSGKRSLMDFVYFVGAFKWWYDLGFDSEGEPIENPNRPPLKMFYFSMKQTMRQKLQKWFCLYMKLEFDLVIDIPTLNSGIGKLYDIDDKTRAKLVAGADFINELEENADIVSGRQTPSQIHNKISRYMNSIGKNEEGRYMLKDAHAGQFTVVCIDDANCLATESDGYGTMNEDALKRTLATYMEEWRDLYNITTVLVAPSKSTYSRNAKDGEPSYKELANFYGCTDVGLVTYNPYNENNNKYLNYPVEDLMIKGKNRFRTISVVKNSNGLENQTVGTIFLGECGYYRESPHPNEEDLFESFIKLLKELP